MKILLITERFDDNIPTGVISKRIADELYNSGNEISIISSELIGKRWEHGTHIVCNKSHLIPKRLLRFVSNLLQINIDTLIWRERLFKAAKLLLNKDHPDIVYARSTPIGVCEVAAKLKNKYGIKVLMHFTDPVPAPIEWDPNKYYRKRMIRTMNRILPMADRISFGNEAMLRYQQSIQNYRFIEKSFVSPDPVPQNSLYYTQNPRKDSTFILSYLGSFHGSRNPEALFKAIGQYNNGERKAVLLVYDTNRTNIHTPNFVKFVGRVNNVKDVLLKSDVLINLDGDDREPVFISSKLKEYLCCGRPIISITPEGSPSRLLTNGFTTVRSVKNISDEIYSALVFFQRTFFSESDYNERKEVITMFTPKKVSEDLLIEINDHLS